MLAGGFFPSYWHAYWVGPLAGAVLAALAYGSTGMNELAPGQRR